MKTALEAKADLDRSLAALRKSTVRAARQDMQRARRLLSKLRMRPR